MILKPQTVIRWHRAGFRAYWRWKSRPRGGRPTTPAGIRRLIRDMSVANPLWGAPRIHGELLKLGIDVGQTTVAKYMARRRQPPSQGWKTFLRNHADGIASMDLFVVPTISFRLLYGFLILRHSRRELLWLGVTAHPSAEWVARQLAEAYGWQQAPRYIIRDRDCIYGAVLTRRLRAMGIRDRPIAPRSPWQNGCAERLIGSIRRDCLDHVVVFGEQHLRHLLKSYQKYYNEARTHLSLHKDAPIPRTVQTVGQTVAVPILGGLHHQYIRAGAAQRASAASSGGRGAGAGSCSGRRAGAAMIPLASGTRVRLATRSRRAPGCGRSGDRLIEAEYPSRIGSCRACSRQPGTINWNPPGSFARIRRPS